MRNSRGILEEFVCGIWFCGDSENFHENFYRQFFAKIKRYFELCQFNTHECCPCLKIFYIFAVLSSQHIHFDESVFRTVLVRKCGVF